MSCYTRVLISLAYFYSLTFWVYFIILFSEIHLHLLIPQKLPYFRVRSTLYDLDFIFGLDTLAGFRCGLSSRRILILWICFVSAFSSAKRHLSEYSSCDFNDVLFSMKNINIDIIYSSLSSPSLFNFIILDLNL